MNKSDQVILVKDSAVLPGAEGLPFSYGRRGKYGLPRMRGQQPLLPHVHGLGNIPRGPQVRQFKQVTDGLDARRGNHGDQCPVPKHDLNHEFETFKADMANKNVKINCSQQRFNDLAVNQETNAIDFISIVEAKGALQAEGQGLLTNIRRPSNPDVRLDFEANDIITGKRIFVDHKSMIDFNVFAAETGKNINKFPTHKKVAYDMGAKIAKQKETFLGYVDGPKSKNDVWHLVDFERMGNPLEKPLLIEYVLQGAERAGCGENIFFLNYEGPFNQGVVNPGIDKQ